MNYFMKFYATTVLILFLFIGKIYAIHNVESKAESSIKELSNSSYRLVAEINKGELSIALYDKKMNILLSNGLIYSGQQTIVGGAILYRKLEKASVTVEGEKLIITGKLAGLDLSQIFILPPEGDIMEEQISLRNSTNKTINLEELQIGFRRRITSKIGRILPEVIDDRIIPLPFRIRPTDIKGEVHDYSLADLLAQTGGVQRVNMNESWFEGKGFSGYVPSMHRSSEGWAWTHENNSFCILKFNQSAMEYSVLTTIVDSDAVYLRFGGSCTVDVIKTIQPGQSVNLGLNRYQTVKGNYMNGLYALRAFLDEHGCHFPNNYNPPVHWNELYDNQFWTLSTPGNPLSNNDNARRVTYTKNLIENEAIKASDYGCESLYLDPGWDTNFGTFIWGESWLGSRKKFIDNMKVKYGLNVSLHCPFAPWMSHPVYRANNPGVLSYPQTTFRKDIDGKLIDKSICMGSHEYLDIAEKRILENCADGVGFLMIDGDWYQGGCWNSDHGHPVPYREENQVNAIIGLIQRIHMKYPNVLIEMHDPIGGGSAAKFTPIYYKYGLPNSFDENWGFELMWRPIYDLQSGAAKALFYYNMGCNIPLYLHVDLREDNQYALVLWWYASTCRHLGIGGSHNNSYIAQLQKQSMQRYRKLERFYKRGEFFGINEEIHLHVLAKENAFVVNLFNLSNETRIISGELHLDKTNLDLNRWYTRSGNWGNFENGIFKVSLKMEPWSAEVGEFYSIDNKKQLPTIQNIH